MNTIKDNFPPYDKIAHFMVAVISIVFVLYIGSGIILPILFSLLIAILLNPIVNFLHRKRLPRILAIILVIVVAVLFISGLIFFLISQLSLLSNMLPQLKIQLTTLSQQTIFLISDKLNISVGKLEILLNNALNNGISDTSMLIGETLVNISSALIIIFIIPVYVFMILFYKPLIMEFIRKVSASEKNYSTQEILQNSKSLVQSYLIGLLIEFTIVSVLNTIGLLIIGVRFAVLLGIIGGLLNIIPYIGGIIAVVITMVFALTTLSASATIWVVVVYILVQFIDNNIIMPYVVASKVKINALTSIIVVLVGNAVWGVPGMFLSIPLTAIIKVIFDRIDTLKPYGFLLGDTMPGQANPIIKKLNPFK